MRTSFGQIIILITLSLLLFGDIKNFKEKLRMSFSKIEKFLKKYNKKKGT